MADLPGNVTYCTINGRLIYADADTSGDVNDLPDMTPATGRMYLTPNTLYVRDPAADVVIVPRTHVVTLLDGYIVNPGNPAQSYIKVVASDNPNMFPRDWTYTVVLELDGVSPLKIPPFAFQALGGVTMSLAQIVPTEVSPGYGLAQAEASAIAAEYWASQGIYPIYHGSNASFARPSNPAAAFWFGTVTPLNLAEGDVYWFAEVGP